MFSVTNWPKIGFGKYYDNTLPQILLNDPGWFFLMLNDRRTWDRFFEGVNELAYKACNIKIPNADPETRKIIWRSNLADGRDAFRIIGPEEPIIDYGFVMSHLDLSWPRRWVCYDIASSAAVSAAVRKNYFEGAELTADRCNAFFSDNENFVLPNDTNFDWV